MFGAVLLFWWILGGAELLLKSCIGIDYPLGIIEILGWDDYIL